MGVVAAAEVAVGFVVGGGAAVPPWALHLRFGLMEVVWRNGSPSRRWVRGLGASSKGSRSCKGWTFDPGS